MNEDSCRLMLLNLYSFVKNKFTDRAEFDYTLFNKYTQKAQKLMDDLVDLELEKIDKILLKIESDPEPEYEKSCERAMWENFRHNCVQGRRTGLGITALGDTIAALGLRYGSYSSINVTEQIYRELALASYDSSIHLAEERGSFPMFDLELELKHPFIQRIMAEDLGMFERFKKYGRRNVALTTTAPAGSVSYETQTTSGIEPIFSLDYTKRRKVDKDKGEKIDHIDESGDCWQEYKVYHKRFLDWKAVTGLENVEDSPYFEATANEIDWESSVKQQSVAQKWICNAISRTVNLPKDISKEEVHKIYWAAWKSGCKGITIYRDGSRDQVMFTEKEEKRGVFTSSEALKRPETLDCDIHRATIQGEKWICLVGLLDDKPYEVFTGLSNKIVLPKKFEHGKIVKHSKKTAPSTYDLVLGDDDEQIVIKDLIKMFDNPNNAMITRLISLALRHGSSIKYVVEQLLKDEADDFTSFSKVVARTLKKYINDGEKVTSDKVCPSCGAENLIYQDGCVSCNRMSDFQNVGNKI